MLVERLVAGLQLGHLLVHEGVDIRDSTGVLLTLKLGVDLLDLDRLDPETLTDTLDRKVSELGVDRIFFGEDHGYQRSSCGGRWSGGGGWLSTGQSGRGRWGRRCSCRRVVNGLVGSDATRADLADEPLIGQRSHERGEEVQIAIQTKEEICIWNIWLDTYTNAMGR